jgi:hypothetical protein
MYRLEQNRTGSMFTTEHRISGHCPTVVMCLLPFSIPSVRISQVTTPLEG